jgi:integrase/recombinase XerD
MRINDVRRPVPLQDHDALNALMEKCKGAYAPSTLSGYRADLKHFHRWCRSIVQEWLPASPTTVASFIDAQIAAYRISTIKRRITAITFAHRMLDLPDPTDNSAVRLSLRRASRSKAQRPEQVQGLTHRILEQILDAPTTNLTGLRDAALVSVGYGDRPVNAPCR